MSVAIVTGASRGIGRACALALAKQGYDANVTYKKIGATSNDDSGTNVLEIVIRDKGNSQVTSESSEKLIEAMDAAYPNVKFTK